MENESTGASAMMSWITKLTRKLTSGKIAPIHYGENLPPSTTDLIRHARSVWIICLSDASLDVEGLFAQRERRKLSSPSPAQNPRRIMFPCPVHNSLDSELQADVVRRTKLAQNWGLDVRWVDHENLQSMVIVNPPVEHGPDLGDGLALIELSLPNTTARAKFEITQRDQDRIFSDLVKSFSQTWGTAHEPYYENNRRPERRGRLLKGLFVA
jgi:hypothetical protein